MGDSGEGLIDNEARIQERMEELRQNREQARKPAVKNPEVTRRLDSLRLARTELARQLGVSSLAARKMQLTAALADIDRRIAALLETA